MCLIYFVQESLEMMTNNYLDNTFIVVIINFIDFDDSNK